MSQCKANICQKLFLVKLVLGKKHENRSGFCIQIYNVEKCNVEYSLKNKKSASKIEKKNQVITI